ncbi:hypothetical protein L7F22_052983 [Adiantum nelumboides]|nr:hypothetical protein [Adiantum nelumboides]
MCPSSYCSRCMPMVAYWPLTDEAGLCESCFPLIQKNDYQHTTPEDWKASNPEVSQCRRSSLFEEYWLLLQRFYTYNLAKCTLSNASLRHPSDQPKTDVASITSQTTAKGLASIGALQNIDAPAGPPFPKEIVQTASQNVKVFGKRLRSPTIRPAKRKICILRLLHDSSSEDEERN